MERKWYLDLWALIREPFKRGIPEIVEFGTIQRGFACSIGMLVINLLVSWSLGFGLSYFFRQFTFTARCYFRCHGWSRYFYSSFYALMAFAVLAIYSVIFSQIANKFGAHTNYESILKICWYQGAYSMVISLILSIVQTILVLIVNGLNLDVYAPDIILYIIGFSYWILQVVAYIWGFWVSLTLVARQIEKDVFQLLVSAF